MPSSFGEKLLAAIGFAAVLVLVAVTLTGGDDEGRAPPLLDPPPAVPTQELPPVTTTTTATPTPVPTTTQRSAGAAVLVVRASRGPSMVSIRAESEGGESLFEGFLTEGRTARASGERLWIRLGRAANVDLTLNGRPVERLHAATIELIATADSVQAAG